MNTNEPPADATKPVDTDDLFIDDTDPQKALAEASGGLDFKALSERQQTYDKAKLADEQPVIQLSPEQERICTAAQVGHNILITGSAGTGKSVLLRELRRRLDTDGFGGRFVVTASTGIAAINVRGATLHSWAGLGLAEGSCEQLLERVRERRKAVQRIREVKRLAIDEISMVSAELLEKLDYVMRHVREERGRPFGGVQIIAYGDFLQLPPVSKGDEKARFAFESEVWKGANFNTGILTKVFRQSDAAFSRALNEFRVGNVTDEAAELFATRYQAKDEDPTFQPIDIYMTNADVDSFNLERLREIDAPEVCYEARDWGEEWDVKAMDKSCLAPKNLRLKVGAQVMLLTNLNIECGLANGTIGRVVALPDKVKGWKCGPTVEFRNGQQRVLELAKWEMKVGDDVVAERWQIPLRLAWAITGHKSQGMTLDKCRVHLANVFEAGQAYVALSRARTLDGLFIQSTRKGCINADPRAVKFYQEAKTL